MKLKTKSIRFRKAAKWRLAYPFDTAYSTVNGSFVVTWAMNTLKNHEGFVCSFRDRDRLDLLRCRLTIKIPEENYAAFVKSFLETFEGYVEQVDW